MVAWGWCGVAAIGHVCRRVDVGRFLLVGEYKNVRCTSYYYCCNYRFFLIYVLPVLCEWIIWGTLFFSTCRDGEDMLETWMDVDGLVGRQLASLRYNAQPLHIMVHGLGATDCSIGGLNLTSNIHFSMCLLSSLPSFIIQSRPSSAASVSRFQVSRRNALVSIAVDVSQPIANERHRE